MLIYPNIIHDLLTTIMVLIDKSLMLNQIKEHYNFKTDSGFAKHLGVSAQVLSNWKARNTYDAELIYTNCLDLNPEWILTGCGNMLKELETNEFISYKSISGEGIPLIPMEAMMGFEKEDPSLYQFERFVIPVFCDAQFLIQIKGSSMSPKYNSGDLIACKTLYLDDIFFQWNKTYVLATEQGALIRRIKKGSDTETILLVSENVEYEAFELQLSKIKAIAIIVGVLKLE